MINFILAGVNYVGPMKEILTANRDLRKSRILDMGTCGGHW